MTNTLVHELLLLFMCLGLVQCVTDAKVDIALTRGWIGNIQVYFLLSSNTPLNGWNIRLTFSRPVAISEVNLYNAVRVCSNDVGTVYIIKNEIYNADGICIQFADSTTNCGFLATYTTSEVPIFTAELVDDMHSCSEVQTKTVQATSKSEPLTVFSAVTFQSEVVPSTTTQSIIDSVTTTQYTNGPSTTIKSTIGPSTTTQSTVDPSATTQPPIDSTTTTQSTIDSTTNTQSTVDPSTTTQSTIDPSTTTQSTVDPLTTTQSPVDLLATTQSTIDSTTTTQTTIDPLTTSLSTIDSSTTIQAIIDPLSTTQSTIDSTTTTQAIIDPSTTTQSTIDPSTTTQSIIDAMATTQFTNGSTSNAQPSIDSMTNAQSTVDPTTSTQSPIDLLTTTQSIISNSAEPSMIVPEESRNNTLLTPETISNSIENHKRRLTADEILNGIFFHTMATTPSTTIFTKEPEVMFFATDAASLTIGGFAIIILISFMVFIVFLDLSTLCMRRNSNVWKRRLQYTKKSDIKS